MAKKRGKKQKEEIVVEQTLLEENETSLEMSDEMSGDVALMEEEVSDELEMAADSDFSAELESEFGGDIESETSIFLQEEEVSEGFLPEVSDDEVEELEASDADDEVSVDGTELDEFDSADIEELEFVEEERLESIVESVLFASDRPVSLASLKLLFKGTNVKGDKIRRALDQLAVEYAGGRRGVTLEEVPGGYQLRTKIDNMEFLKRTLKARQFKLSGPALEVLSIVAYKQPLVKSEVDEIRGVESGHLLRALMEKNLVCFEGKSELPGRPMQYGTTKKFLEIFGLRTIKELPTLSQIDELLPEGIDEQQAEEKQTLASLTDSLSENFNGSYSQGEDELMKIQEQLEDISTSTNFFEEEKRRQAEKRDAERAQGIRDALAFGEPVSTRDQNWLIKFDEAIAAGTSLIRIAEEKKAQFMKGSKVPQATEGIEEAQVAAEFVAEQGSDIAEGNNSENEMTSDEFIDENNEDNLELAEAIEAFDADEDSEYASDDSLDEEIEVEDEALLADSADEDSSEDEEDELPFLGEADDIDEEDGASF